MSRKKKTPSPAPPKASVARGVPAPPKASAKPVAAPSPADDSAAVPDAPSPTDNSSSAPAPAPDAPPPSDASSSATATAATGDTDRTGSPAAPPAPDANGDTDGNDGNGRPAGQLINDSLGGMLAQNFIEYASYVIKDRAIPDVADGLKPVQRRILHALWELDDGRFHKVANVIGHAMRYHPHGDASIGDALVVLANKEYFIDRQGNFGNIFTGDAASAARYIECRLTPLAKDVLFNPEITEFVDSYDGRNREPVLLPCKIPALLLLGADGIAVGMATRILPHNFNDVLKAQISLLKGRTVRVYPDFQTGGIMDVSEYADGNGRIKLRARIDAVDEKTLIIREIPASTTTESLMNSIIEASRRGKLKIAAINDYTSEAVEIEIKLPRGIYADECVKQLYAYTDCEVSLSVSLVVIRDNKPVIMTATEVIRYCTDRLVAMLKRELEISLGKLQERFHEKTLAQIFIENRLYKRIEECETYDKVLAAVHRGLAPFKDRLRRAVTDEDVERLLQLQIRRISLFDIQRNQEEIEGILEDLRKTQHNLKHLTDYAIAYLKALLDKYGKGYPRRTRISDIEDIDAREVALENIKVGFDRVNHFVGRDVKNSNKNEEPLACTEYDRLVLMQSDGRFRVVPIPEKLYVGAIRYVLKADRDQVYSLLYRMRKTGKFFAKRFRISSYIMDKEYATLPDGCIIEALHTNYGMVLRCEYKKQIKGAAPSIDVDFGTVEIRATGARGFKVSDRPVGDVTVVRRGSLTPGGPEEEPPPAPVAGFGGDAAPPAAGEPGAAPPVPASPAPAEPPAKADPPLPPVAGRPAKARRDGPKSAVPAEPKSQPEPAPRPARGRPRPGQGRAAGAGVADSAKPAPAGSAAKPSGAAAPAAPQAKRKASETADQTVPSPRATKIEPAAFRLEAGSAVPRPARRGRKTPPPAGPAAAAKPQAKPAKGAVPAAPSSGPAVSSKPAKPVAAPERPVAGKPAVVADAQDGAKPKPKPKGKIRIDEDTPFFLE